MSNQLAIVSYRDKIISAYLKDDKLFRVHVTIPEKKELLGNIYVGKVVNVVKNINAAFVEIEGKQVCYLSLKEEKDAVFVNAKNGAKIVQGDEILVQVKKDSIKTKAPTVTTRLTLTGRFAVLVKGESKILISQKIRQEKEKIRLTILAEEFRTDNFSFIMRTNGTEASDEEIKAELNELRKNYESLMEFGTKRTCYSLVYKNKDELSLNARNYMNHSLDRIITDLPEVYSSLRELFGEHKEEQDKVLLYEDDSYPLIKMLGLETKLSRVLSEKVWLKSGGSLVIQPTEALTAIDVNTERAIAGKRNPETTFFKVNLEAAEEICRQLQARNLSGIIIVDFIDMKKEEHRKELLSYMRGLLREDPVKAVLVDMTPLGLVEITRMKREKPLHELLS